MSWLGLATVQDLPINSKCFIELFGKPKNRTEFRFFVETETDLIKKNVIFRFFAKMPNETMVYNSFPYSYDLQEVCLSIVDRISLLSWDDETTMDQVRVT